MPSMTFAELATRTSGRLITGGDLPFDSVVIDSREARHGAVFFAIVGEKNDGHRFVPEALRVCAGAVVETIPREIEEGKGFVQVDDTVAGLQSMARSVREDYPFVLIAITGSTGKTTTKELIAAVVETEKQGWKSRGNFNNHIGFPLCLANTPDGTEVVVSEMGMSARGEIEFLAKLSYPDIAVYTNIHPVHLEFFESIEGIAAAKRELLENLSPEGAVVLNADDARVLQISLGFEGRRVTYGIDCEADYRVTDIRDRGLLGSEFVVDAEGDRFELAIALCGRHNVENALAAVAAARVVGISWNGIRAGLRTVIPASHRGESIEWNGATIYDDTYNSNPHALASALALLSTVECSGRRIAVLGDMLELGAEEVAFHRESGRAIPPEVDVVIGVGRLGRAIVDGAHEAGYRRAMLMSCQDADHALQILRGFIEPKDFVLLKASRGIGLDRVIAGLEKKA